MSEASQRIFLSYARSDVAFARELREWLLKQGHQPWMDLFDIPAGARWPTEIDRALKSSEAIMGLLSPAAVQSENVLNEWDWAIANGRQLILLLIEPCEIPFHYVSRNYIDMAADESIGFDLLATALESGVRPAAGAPTGPADEPTSDQGATTTRPSPQPPATPLVGRARELERGIATLETALGGRGQLLLLAGEPGIGKTRLAEEIAFTAQAQGAGIFWGHCYEWEGAPAYWPWIEILRDLIEGLDPGTLQHAVGSGALFIAQIVPEIRDRLQEVPELPRMNPDQARFRLFDAVMRFVRAASREQPSVLVLDDLHWADNASLLLLEFFVRELEHDPVLLVGTYRDVEVRRDHPLSRTLGGLVRSREVQRLVLRGLDAPSIANLIEQETGQEPDNQLVQTIFGATEGNPFFAGEIVRLLAQEDRSVWRIDGTGQQSISIPEGIRDALGRRLDRLSSATNELLAAGSVIGRDFDLDTLSRVTGQSQDEMLDLLDEALATRIIEEREQFGRYRFSHALVQQTLYEELSSSRRVQLHSRVGQALEDHHAGNLSAHYEDLARHYAIAPLGDNLGKAIDYATKAGNQAMRRLAWESALGHFAGAVQLAEEYGSLEDRARCDLLLRLYEAQMRTGAYEAGYATFERIVPLVQALDDIDLLTRAALGFVSTDMSPGAPEAGRTPLLERLLSRLPEDDYSSRIRAMSQLAIRLVSAHGAERRRAELAGSAVDMAKKFGDDDRLAYALLGNFHAAIRNKLPLEQVKWQLTEAGKIIDVASRADNADLAAWGSMFRIVTLVQLTRIDEARAELERFTIWTHQTRTDIDLIAAAMAAARLEYIQGRLEAGDEMLQKADFEASLQRSSTNRMIFGASLFDVHREQERLSEREALYRARTVEFSDRKHPWWDLALVLCELGKIEEAKTIYARLVTDRSSLVSYASERIVEGVSIHLVDVAEIAIYLDDQRTMQEVYDLLLPYEPLFGFDVYTQRSPISHYLGLLATELERWSLAEQHFTAAIAMCEQMGARFYLARSQYAHAEMLHRRNRPGDRYHALELLDQALGLARDIGMVRLERQATELQERLKAQG